MGRPRKNESEASLDDQVIDTPETDEAEKDTQLPELGRNPFRDSDNDPEDPTTEVEKVVADYDGEVGVNIEDDIEENTSTPEYVSSIVNGFRYFFPVERCRSFAEGISLGKNFVVGNLKDGQIFSFNPQRNSPFLFVPECGITLNPSNATWIYREKNISDIGRARIVELVNTGDLVLGEYGITKIVQKAEKPKLNHEVILAGTEAAIRDQVIKILGTRVTVSEFGEVYSPAIELKAMLDSEMKGQNRDRIKKLLNTAIQRTGGQIEFTGDEEAEEAIQAKQAIRFGSQGWDNRDGIAASVNIGSVL